MDTHDIVSGFEMYRRAVNPARFELLRSHGGPIALATRMSWLKTHAVTVFDFVCGYGTATLGHDTGDHGAPTRCPHVKGALTYPCSISTKAGELGSELCARLDEGAAKFIWDSGAEGIEAA